jgi:hypothetical protein
MWLFILAVLAALGVGYFFGKQQQKDTGVQLSVPKTPFEHNARTVDGLGAVSTSVVTRDDDRVPANVL